MSKRDPLDQLAALRIEVSDETRTRDLNAIRDELRRRPPWRVPRRSRWTLGAVVAVLVAGPVAAVASDDAAPGDALYPIKLATEPIIRLFDRDAVAEHRVEEVAVLVDRDSQDAVIEQRITIARDALAETDAPRLEQELDRIVDLWIADRPAPEVIDPPPATTVPLRDQPDPGDRSREPEPLDTPQTTSTTITDQPSDTHQPDPTTPTTPPPTDERPPSDDRPRDTP